MLTENQQKGSAIVGQPWPAIRLMWEANREPRDPFQSDGHIEVRRLFDDSGDCKEKLVGVPVVPLTLFPEKTENGPLKTPSLRGIFFIHKSNQYFISA